MKNVFTTAVFLCTVLSGTVLANNITVSNVTLTGQNISAGTNNAANYALVQFDISWDNSWRTSSSAPVNWDAAWVFVKYRKSGTTVWNHATLNTTAANHTAPSGSTIAQSDGTGVFVYRSGNGTGTFTLADVELRWQYGTDGVLDTNTLEVAVQAIEMVYVPQGSFAAGSGGSETSKFTLTTINTATATTAPSGTGSLGGAAGGYPSSQSAPTNATWPNGYDAFYCMKYEISQEQYVEFLNTLTRAQQNTRTSTSLAAGTTSITDRYVMSSTNTLSNRNGIRCDAAIHTSNPITFYCDFDGDGTGNETVDGQNIACNFLSWADVAAYMDWSGLRPMTELEYEKACRGTLSPVANEYAWGEATVANAAYTLSAAAGTSTEAIATNYSITDGNASYSTTDGSIDGPLRVGIFADASGTRVRTGASYYGIMEMSGNLWERPVTIGNADGRNFTGTHGNGALDATGDADASTWPVTTAVGAGFRGGCWASPAAYLRVSDRIAASIAYTTRNNDYGGRGVRVAP
jgi:formylglycine-generating enzyme required for sulfatase activity